MATEKFSEFTLASDLDGSETVVGLKDHDNAQYPITFFPITKKVSLTSPQILALFTTPITAIAAPGSGKFIRLLGLFSILNYNSSQYSSGSPIYLSTGSLAPISTDVFTANANKIEYKAISTTSLTGTNDTLNAPLLLSCLSANPTAGDGTLDLYITYIVASVL